MNLQRQITKNLLELSTLEQNFNENFNDQYLIKQINLYKKSFAFFLKEKDEERALYESNCLISFLVFHLTD